MLMEQDFIETFVPSSTDDDEGDSDSSGNEIVVKPAVAVVCNPCGNSKVCTKTSPTDREKCLPRCPNRHNCHDLGEECAKDSFEWCECVVDGGYSPRNDGLDCLGLHNWCTWHAKLDSA